MTTQTIKASIIGVTGYTGTELLRCLLQHPHVDLQYLVSRQYNREPISKVFPRLSHLDDLTIGQTDYDTVARDSDIVFACLPHGSAQDVVPEFLGKTKIIDMSADFRLRDATTYKSYYQAEHRKPELLNGRFVYGAPEIFRKDIAQADAVANPGCFALLIQLLLLPLKGRIEAADVMAISGTSGGGRSPRDPVDHPYCAQNIRSYLINEHRHTPEILSTTGLDKDRFNFAPTVGPFMRGIFAHATLCADAIPDTAFYTDSPFVRIVDKVQMTNIVSNNFVDLSYAKGNNNTIIAQGALDNLLKGASGTAIQNMNLMFGMDERAGLNFDSPIYP